MALTFAQVGAFQEGVGAQFKMTQTSVTLDASYASGGIPLTARQLGLGVRVAGGHATVNTAAATGPSGGTLVPQADGSCKLKLANAGNTAELGAGVGSGAVLDVLAFGV